MAVSANPITIGPENTWPLPSSNGSAPMNSGSCGNRTRMEFSPRQDETLKQQLDGLLALLADRSGRLARGGLGRDARSRPTADRLSRL